MRMEGRLRRYARDESLGSGSVRSAVPDRLRRRPGRPDGESTADSACDERSREVGSCHLTFTDADAISAAHPDRPTFAVRVARRRDRCAARRRVETLLNQSRSDRETADSQRDELAHEIGGEFAFGDARAAACAAAAWLELGQAELAEADAGAALDLYQQLEERARPFSPVNGLRIDVATARLLRIDVDGARHALGPVLTLEPAKRNSALIGRMSVMRAELSASRWTRDSVADDLLSTIDDWLRHSAAGHLPPDGIS
jgi:hypothetical protein